MDNVDNSKHQIPSSSIRTLSGRMRNRQQLIANTLQNSYPERIELRNKRTDQPQSLDANVLESIGENCELSTTHIKSELLLSTSKRRRRKRLNTANHLSTISTTTNLIPPHISLQSPDNYVEYDIDDDYHSPRPTVDDLLPVARHALDVPSTKRPARSASMMSTDSSLLPPLNGDEIDSRILSFNVRDRLHTFAREIQRRTSEVREHIRRPATPDNESLLSSAGTASRTDQHRRSLTSFIGYERSPLPSDINRMGPTIDKTRFIFVRWWLLLMYRIARLMPASIDPNGKKYVSWLSLVVISFVYNALCIPLRSAYPYQTRSNLVYWLTFDYLCDLIYLIDLLIVKPRLRFMRGGIAVTSRVDMRRHYLMSGSFKLDVLALLPLDVLYIWIGPVVAVRFMRLLKFMCFGQMFHLLDKWVSNPYMIRILKTLLYMLYIIHCNSCVYYVLSAWQGFGQIAYRVHGQWRINKWVYDNRGNAYASCFYYAAAVATSTGNNPSPTNVVEYMYMTFSWMMGVFVFALLLGQIRDIVTNASRNREQYRKSMDMALSECKKLRLPPNLIDRVRNWFIYTWEHQKTLDENRLISQLPHKLQTDLALSVHYNTLSKDCDRALLRDLVLKLRPVIFLPGDLVCRKGDVGKEMYIVNHGVLEVVGGENNTEVYAKLTEGSVFGEISLLAIGGNNRRTANIRSKGYSNLFVLSKADLNEVIRDYPDAQRILKRKARRLLRNDEKKEEQLKHEAEDFEKTCAIKTDHGTPQILATISRIMNPSSATSQQLQSALAASSASQRLLRPTVSGAVSTDDSDAEINQILDQLMAAQDR